MFIYVLKDPDTKIVCYVGKTNNPTKRLSSHRNPGKKSQNLPSVRWNRKLKELGKAPIMEIIEETDDWEACEKRWIAFYRNQNKDLLNVDEGGIVEIGICHRQRKNASKKYMSVLSKLINISKEMSGEYKVFWVSVREAIMDLRLNIEIEMGKDAVNYFDDCIYNEFINRNPGSFRILA